jgi:SNF2 family DNA or RNA helicase
MTPAQAIAYKELKTQTFADLDQTGDLNSSLFIGNVLARIMHLRRMALDPAFFGLDDEGVKWPWLLDWVQTYPDVPFVVFTHSREYAAVLAKLLNNVSVVDYINGDVPQLKRDEILKKFTRGVLNGIIGTIDTMSESINLQRAEAAIFMELHVSSIAMDQATDRCHRIDSKHVVNVIRLLCKDTVDELILAKLDKKWSDRQLVEAFLQGAEHDFGTRA